MKRSLNILALLLLFAAFIGCNDLLDNAQPSQSISQSAALSSEGGVEAIRASMYDRLTAFGYATRYFLGSEALADNLINRNTATRFLAYNENSENTGMLPWGLTYSLVNDANLIINGVKEGVLSPENLNRYRGEAYMLRAFAMHHAVRSAGYEPGMIPSAGPGAGFELGIIIRTQPTLGVSDANYRPRKTVSQVYDQIISDLNNSISLLRDNGGSTRTFVTLAAAQALMARVQLYAGDYQKADEFATKALNNTSARLATPAEVVTMFDETTGLNPEAIFVVNVDPNTQSLGVNDSPAVYTSEQYVAQIPTQDLLDLYDPSDARLVLYNPCFDETDGSFEAGCRGTTIPGRTLPPEASGVELSKWAAERGQYADNLPFLRVSEMKLIQSEARLKSSGDASEPINDLRENRNLSDLTSVTMQDILDERRREFAGEGQRYFDLKRLGRTIQKAPSTTSTVVDPVPYTNNRILDNIPYNQVSLSEANADPDSVLIQNPGY